MVADLLSASYLPHSIDAKIELSLCKVVSKLFLQVD